MLGFGGGNAARERVEQCRLDAKGAALGAMPNVSGGKKRRGSPGANTQPGDVKHIVFISVPHSVVIAPPPPT